jgi:hypothetical protein
MGLVHSHYVANGKYRVTQRQMIHLVREFRMVPWVNVGACALPLSLCEYEIFDLNSHGRHLCSDIGWSDDWWKDQHKKWSKREQGTESIKQLTWSNDYLPFSRPSCDQLLFKSQRPGIRFYAGNCHIIRQFWQIESVHNSHAFLEDEFFVASLTMTASFSISDGTAWDFPSLRKFAWTNSWLNQSQPFVIRDVLTYEEFEAFSENIESDPTYIWFILLAEPTFDNNKAMISLLREIFHSFVCNNHPQQTTLLLAIEGSLTRHSHGDLIFSK